MLQTKRIRTVVGVALAALLCLASTAFSAPHDMLPEAIKAKGEIVIGINGIYPPMEYKEPGKDELLGFDVDLAKALGTALGVKVVFDDQKFDQLINSVNTGRVDMVLSGMSDTEVRRKTLDFVDYFKSGTQCFTLNKYAGEVTKLEDLSGKTFAVSAATDYLPTMKQWSEENLEAKGKPGVTILGVDSEATARLQMIQGRAQASAISPEVLGWLSKENPGLFVPFGPVLNPDPYGMAFAKSNTALRDAVYAAFKELFANGTYKAILDQWQMAPGAIDAPMVNGEQL